jgi:hypothetical protein
MRPNQIKKRMYIQTRRLARNEEHKNLQYAPQMRLGYKINDTFAAFLDYNRASNRYNRWELIHIPTNASVTTTKTLKNAIYAAYAFIPADMQCVTVENYESGLTIWTDRDAKDRAIETYKTLNECGINVA